MPSETMLSPSVNQRFDWPTAILFCIGLISCFSVKVVGTLYASDIAFLAATPFVLIYNGHRSITRLPAWVLLLAGLWLIGAIVTDVVRDSPFENYTRGWAKIICFAAAFLCVLLISRLRLKPLMAFFLGLALADIAGVLFFPTAYQMRLPWKFGYADPVSIIAAILASGSPVLAVPTAARRYGGLVALGIVNVFLGYRSMFSILLGTVGATFASDRIGGGRAARPSPYFLVATMIAAVGGSMIIANGYGYAARGGYLGRDAQTKYEYQSRAGLGVLLGGRSESLISTRAIYDSPLIGHGSWAEDRFYAALYLQELRARGLPPQAELASNIIPSHSYLLGSWVEAGIFGGLFWLFCLVVAARALILLLGRRDVATPFVAYMIIKLMWDIPFSPFGAAERFTAAGQLCVILWTIQQAGFLSRDAERSHVSTLSSIRRVNA